MNTDDIEKICRTVAQFFPGLFQQTVDTARQISNNIFVRFQCWLLALAKNFRFRFLRIRINEIRYVRIWTRLFVFIIRFHRLNKIDQKRYWGLVFPADIARATSILIKTVRHYNETTRPNDGGRDSYRWERNQKSPFWENRIVADLHQLFMAVIVPVKRERDIRYYLLVYFTGVLALTENGGFLRPNDTTHLIAALIHMNRILFFHHHFPVRPARSDVESDFVFIPENQNANVSWEFDPEPPMPDPFYTEADFDELDQYMDIKKQAETNEDRKKQNRTDGDRKPVNHTDHENDKYFERFELFETEHAKYLLYFFVYFFAELAQLLVKGNYINKH